MANYGQGDSTYQTAGGLDGVRALVNAFYDTMERNPAYATILSWHPQTLDTSRDKLTLFLCGWMGGPRFFQETYGSISIPGAHAHLDVTAAERDQWLDCMAEAIDQRGYAPDFKAYLLKQLGRPAEMIRRQSEKTAST
ncbi:MAG: group II truncated hemoglobin [Pseudomonadota bacterium]